MRSNIISGSSPSARPTIESNIAETFAAISVLEDRLGELSNRLFGPVPSEVSPPEPTAMGVIGQTGVIRSRLGRLNERLGEMLVEL